VLLGRNLCKEWFHTGLLLNYFLPDLSKSSGRKHIQENKKREKRLTSQHPWESFNQFALVLVLATGHQLWTKSPYYYHGRQFFLGEKHYWTGFQANFFRHLNQHGPDLFLCCAYLKQIASCVAWRQPATKQWAADQCLLSRCMYGRSYRWRCLESTHTTWKLHKIPGWLNCHPTHKLENIGWAR